MKDKLKDELTGLTDKIMKEASLETPSNDFTINVMSRIEELGTSTVYQPLISKKMWVVIALGIAALMFLALSGSIESMTLFSDLRLNFDLYKLLPSLSVSSPFMYGVFFLSILLIIQVPFLKYYFDKRLGV